MSLGEQDTDVLSASKEGVSMATVSTIDRASVEELAARFSGVLLLPDEVTLFGGLLHTPGGSGTRIGAIVACHAGPLA